MKSASNSIHATEPNQLIWIAKEVAFSPVGGTEIQCQSLPKFRFAPLQPLRQWLDGLQIRDRAMAHRICQLIPAQCPFERTVKLFGRTILQIPPLCKLNPLYEQFVSLRFRALCYLADECGEDISQYC
jgi:hypothetical protein